jgi:hypothetical protein
VGDILFMDVLANDDEERWGGRSFSIHLMSGKEK